MPISSSIDAETNSGNGFASWVEVCSLSDWGVVTRVTIMAVASDRNSAGICATSPSPIVSKV